MADGRLGCREICCWDRAAKVWHVGLEFELLFTRKVRLPKLCGIDPEAFGWGLTYKLTGLLWRAGIWARLL